MSVTGPTADASRKTFLALVLGKSKGFMCVAIMSPLRRDRLMEKFFHWPDDLDKILEYVNSIAEGHNVYVCPQLFDFPSRRKENVSVTPCAWADLDTCDPSVLHIPPSVVVRSSAGRYQAYWTFDRPVDPDDAEDLSRRIAYKHAMQGADRSGWDLTQLLRMPFTYNYKYAKDDQELPLVQTTVVERTSYRLKEFEEWYPDVASFVKVEIPLPAKEDMPQETGEEILQRKRQRINPRIWELFTSTPPDNVSWSEPLWSLLMLLFEMDYSKEEVFVIARDAGCNKYQRDHKSELLLWKDVCRAWNKNEQNLKILTEGVRGDEDESLLSEEERQRVISQPKTFIERYQEWARSLGDAAPQYHQAGAFIALSSLLAGAVRLPTSFGTIVPNMWFMILADTTLTRKTTAMDIAMDMIEQIDSNTVLATDGSIEGLLTGLSTRPGIPSVFLRDEFSGLLEAMTKKDYYAGMPEMFTKLYDGKMQKRILRKEVIEVRDPILVFFAGGIRERITQLLTHEHIQSGFIPRFIFITAESDVSKLRPLGPPTEENLDTGEAIRDELQEIYSHYRATIRLEIKGARQAIETAKRWSASLTPEAWIRYNKLEAQMLDTGLRSGRQDLMTPLYDRLSKSILKAAVLLSASRQRNGEVVVTEDDILRAIMYGEQWRVHARGMVKTLGRGSGERQLDSIHRQIFRNPGVARSSIMQYHHLGARQATEAFETLVQRGLVSRERAGRTERFYSQQVPASEVEENDSASL